MGEKFRLLLEQSNLLSEFNVNLAIGARRTNPSYQAYFYGLAL